jgi:hypothetical protein
MGKDAGRLAGTSSNGAAALYVATRNARFTRAAERQLNAYIHALKS